MKHSSSMFTSVCSTEPLFQALKTKKASVPKHRTINNTCSMSESCETKVIIPCSGNWDSLLKNLYLDLFNLIVESRIPGINDRGYGDGSHCPPLLGPNVHLCDLSKPECQKHQRLIHHLLQAVRHNVFEIEVLMLPDCCSESKLSERIQNKEYILLERWSMKCIYSKTQSTIEVPELLRAVRSFLHFSQISAWLSLTKGKSPSNICYWVKPTADPSSTQFEVSPEAHSFPVCKINDGICGIVKVNYPTRKQYIPIIPCSKHPPLHGLTFRTITDDPNLTQNIPLNSQLVKQLQKTCENQQSVISVKHHSTDSEPLIIAPASLLKTVSHNVADVNKTNRILKHSNSQISTQNSFNSISNPSCNFHLSEKNEMSSNSETAYVCRATYSKCTSQENVCLNKKSLNTNLSRKESKLNVINKVLLPSICELSSTPLEVTHEYLPEQAAIKNCDASSKLSNSELCIISNVSNVLIQAVETSQSVSSTLLDCQSLLSMQRNCQNALKTLKRKQTDECDEVHIIPGKKRQVVLKRNNEFSNSHPCDYVESSLSSQENAHKKSRKRKHCNSQINLKKTAKLVHNIISLKTNESFSVKTEISEKFNLYKNASICKSVVSPSTVSKNVKSAELSDKNEFLQPLKSETKYLSHKKSNNIQFSDSYGNDGLPLFRCPQQNSCKNESCDKDLNVENELSDDSYSNNSKLASTQTKRISNFTKQFGQNEFVNKNDFKNVAKRSENAVSEYMPLQVQSRSICTPKLYFNSNELLQSVCSTIEHDTFHRKCKDIHADKMVELPCQDKHILNTSLDMCRNNSTRSKPYIHTKCSTSISPQIKEFKLKKRYSKTFFKSKKARQLEESGLCSSSNYEIFPLCTPTKDKDRLLNPSVHGMNIARKNKVFSKSSKSFRKLKKFLCDNSNKSLKKISSKALLKNEYKKETNDTSDITQNESRETIKNANAQKITEVTNILSDEQFIKSRDAVACISSHKFSNINHFGYSAPVSLICNERMSEDNNLTKNLELSANSPFSNTVFLNRKSITSFQNLQHNQDSSKKELEDISTSVLDSPLYGKKSTPISNNHCPSNFCTVLHQKATSYLDCFPRHKLKFARGQKLLGNFEESILKGCLPPASNVKGFYVEIGASGSFCPNHITLPAEVSFYELDNPHSGTTPYMAHVTLSDSEYYLPKKGAVQVTLFNPSETVVKMFVLNYDLSDMPPMCHTFIRQKTYFMPIGASEESSSSPKWLRFIIHLRFASSKTGKVYLHKDFKIVVLNKSNDDAASEFSQEPRELCSFLHGPMNPTYSTF